MFYNHSKLYSFFSYVYFVPLLIALCFSWVFRFEFRSEFIHTGELCVVFYPLVYYIFVYIFSNFLFYYCLSRRQIRSFSWLFCTIYAETNFVANSHTAPVTFLLKFQLWSRDDTSVIKLWRVIKLWLSTVTWIPKEHWRF